MKKSFSLKAGNHKPDRVVELIKAEVNKYLARERRKKLPEGVDYWDFSCRVGKDADSALMIQVTEIGKQIDKTVTAPTEQVYIEILAKPGIRNKRPSRTEE